MKVLLAYSIKGGIDALRGHLIIIMQLDEIRPTFHNLNNL